MTVARRLRVIPNRCIMRLTRSLFVSVACLFACAAAPARAADPAKLFYIPAESGYGIEECFSAGATCGKVVADAYCEANGYGVALAFGRSEDVTASIVAAATAAPSKNAFVVACSN